MTHYKTVILFAFISVIGAMLLPWFSIDLIPRSNLPILTISYSLPGSSPETVEQEMTSPLENVLSQLTGLKNIYSISNQNHGVIELTFNKDIDIDQKRFEVSSVIRRYHDKLSKDSSYPIIEQQNRETESKKVLLLYRINSALTPFQIKKTVNEIFVPEISRLSNIKQVDISGAENLNIVVEYDYRKITDVGITPDKIISRIRENFTEYYPGFSSETSGRRMLIKINPPINDISKLENLVLSDKGHFIRLKDVASIFLEENKPRQLYRINGLNSVSLAIYGDENVNRIELAKDIKQTIATLSEKLPVGYQLLLDYDDTEFIKKEISKNYVRSVSSIAILIFIILLSYRDWRHIIILATSVLINLALTAVIAFPIKISIHLYTIAGISISFGMIVDNIIIMLDGLTSERNANRSIKAIIGGTLTTMLSLLLIFFLPEEERYNLGEFSLIITIALVASIFISTFYIPAIYELITKERAVKSSYKSIHTIRKKVWLLSMYFNLIAIMSRYRGIVFFIVLMAFGVPLFLLPQKWEGHNWYNKTIGSRFYDENIRPYSDKILGGSLRIFVREVYERSGYRAPQQTRLYVYASLPSGSTLDEMNKAMLYMEEYLKPVKGIKYVTEVLSGQNANITIAFHDTPESNRLPFLLKSRLIKKSLSWSGVEWDIYGVGQSFSTAQNVNLPSFQVKIKGYNLVELTHQAEILADKLRKIKRIKNIEINTRQDIDEKTGSEYILDLDVNKMRGYAVSANSIGSFLKDKNPSSESQYMIPLGMEYLPLSVRENNSQEFTAFNALEDRISFSDRNLKLSSFATVKLDRSAVAIHRENRQYIRTVSFDYHGSLALGNVYLDTLISEARREIPIGYTVEKTSFHWDWQKVKRQYYLLFILLIGLYFVCSILLNDLRLPFYIILNIPVSFIGLFLIFSIFDFYFDQGGYAAFVLLGGLTVNASILILTNFKNGISRRRPDRLIIKTIAVTLRPILLTTLSTCAGLVPFLLGSQHEVFWFSLAVGTVAGLAMSLFGTLVLLPICIFNYKQTKSNL